jgi:hypothetical protein
MESISVCEYYYYCYSPNISTADLFTTYYPPKSLYNKFRCSIAFKTVVFLMKLLFLNPWTTVQTSRTTSTCTALTYLSLSNCPRSYSFHFPWTVERVSAFESEQV